MPLTVEQRAEFKQRVNAGLNPAQACGFCGSGAVKVEGHAHYCEDCLDWEPNGVEVHCGSCGATYRVIRRQGCQKDGEEREKAHFEARAYRNWRAWLGIAAVAKRLMEAAA
jgi:hypothetical protein